MSVRKATATYSDAFGKADATCTVTETSELVLQKDGSFQSEERTTCYCKGQDKNLFEKTCKIALDKLQNQWLQELSGEKWLLNMIQKDIQKDILQDILRKKTN